MKRPQAGEPYGLVTLDRHREYAAKGVYLHVFVNGVDVTSRCKIANDSADRNMAVLFRLNADGKKFAEVIDGRSTVAREVVSGGVEIRAGAPFE